MRSFENVCIIKENCPKRVNPRFFLLKPKSTGIVNSVNNLFIN